MQCLEERFVDVLYLGTGTLGVVVAMLSLTRFDEIFWNLLKYPTPGPKKAALGWHMEILRESYHSPARQGRTSVFILPSFAHLVLALQRSDAILQQRLPRFRFVRQNRVLIFLARVVTPWASPIEPGLMFRIVVAHRTPKPSQVLPWPLEIPCAGCRTLGQGLSSLMLGSPHHSHVSMYVYFVLCLFIYLLVYTSASLFIQ